MLNTWWLPFYLNEFTECFSCASRFLAFIYGWSKQRVVQERSWIWKGIIFLEMVKTFELDTTNNYTNWICLYYCVSYLDIYEVFSIKSKYIKWWIGAQFKAFQLFGSLQLRTLVTAPIESSSYFDTWEHFSAKYKAFQEALAVIWNRKLCSTSRKEPVQMIIEGFPVDLPVQVFE